MEKWNIQKKAQMGKMNPTYANLLNFYFIFESISCMFII